ncbi:MAG TPA: cytochrome c [Candidatus Angelobacter sp.]|nr:cytochrome c [Candidatus Angelobacter sp.]
MSTAISTAFLALAMLLAIGAAAKTNDGKNSTAPANTTANSSTAAATTAAISSTQDENLHLEGEKRFRSNCGRCHTAPPKFPSRMMATIVRHMRVRANITDADMRLILRYMTE